MGIRAFGHTTKAEVSQNETGNITLIYDFGSIKCGD
jgi:hypothetical protein